MRLIDADKLVEKVLRREGVFVLKVEDIKSIYGVPMDEIIVDAEPIVRCSDCKLCKTVDDIDMELFGICRYHNSLLVKADDFCSRGVKK